MTKVTEAVKNIIKHYGSDNPGVKSNLVRILMHGKLGGTGKMLILPVDQGFEHGPIKSFAVNEVAHDPMYLFKLAIAAGVSAYAAPLGMLEMGADKYAGEVPLILKMNSSNALAYKQKQPNQAITANVQDALRIGCVAVGLTLYPGSGNYDGMVEEAREIIAEARSNGLAIVLWSYPRGGDLSKEGETALDVIAYGAHMACLLGAHIIKVKLPTFHMAINSGCGVKVNTLVDRIKYVKRACFDGKKIVVFSGGNSKNLDILYKEVKAIKEAGGNGSIIGRNAFQRNFEDALSMLDEIVNIYSV